MPTGPVFTSGGLYLPPGVDLGPYQQGLPFGAQNPYGAPTGPAVPQMPSPRAVPTASTPTPAPASAPAANPATSPAPDLAREAAAQARSAAPTRPSVLRQNLAINANQMGQSDLTRLANQARAGTPSPAPAQVGANPPSNLPPAAQGVRGAGGAGAPLGSPTTATAAGGAPTGGAGAAYSGGPNPRVGSALMQAFGAGAPPPPGIASTPGVFGFNPAGKWANVGGIKGGMANAVVGGAGLMATNQALANENAQLDWLDQGQQDALRRILGTTGRGAAGTTILGGPTAGVVAGVGGGAMQTALEARRWADQNGPAGQAGAGLFQSGMQMGGPLGQVGVLGAGIADSLGIDEPLADYANRVSEMGIPLVSGVAGWFGDGTAGQPSQEEQQAAAEEQRRRAEMATPEYMLPALQRAGLPKGAAQQYVAEFEASLQQNMVMNELGQFPVLADAEGNRYMANPQTGAFERPDGNGGVETKSADDLRALNDAELRDYTAQNFYAGIPEFVAADQQRRDAMNQAAAMQAMMSQYTDPLLARSEQTAAAYEAAGDPLGAALARDSMTSQAAMMRALPMLQAIDEQQQWDQRIAQIQQEQMLNELFYGGSDQGGQTLDDVTSGTG